MYIYIYIWVRLLGYIWVPHSPPWLVWGLFGPSGIHKTGLGCQKGHPRSIFIDFTNMCKCKCVICMISYEFTWFRGYEKDAERYLESTCPRILAWALFWTCLVKETMFANIDKYLCIYASIDRSIDPSICLFIYLSIYLCIYLSLYLCIYLSIYISIYLSIYPSVECIKAARSAAEDSSIYIYIYMLSANTHRWELFYTD